MPANGVAVSIRSGEGADNGNRSDDRQSHVLCPLLYPRYGLHVPKADLTLYRLQSGELPQPTCADLLLLVIMKEFRE